MLGQASHCAVVRTEFAQRAGSMSSAMAQNADNAPLGPRARSSSDSGLSTQQIAACSDEIKRTQVESQRWSGNANDVAARLGKFQKEMFEGRCAGHPEASAYLAGANRMLGHGGNPNAGSGSSSRLAQGKESLDHNPVHDATNCIKLYGPAEMKARGMHSVMPSTMVNTCAFPIAVTWCVEAGNGRRGDCNPGFSNLHNLSAVGGAPNTNRYGVDAVNQNVKLGACRSAERWGFRPLKFDAQRPFAYACK